MSSIFWKILGVICILLGLFALVTPFTPGSWLILVGLELLGLGFLIPKKIRGYWEKTKDAMKRKKGKPTLIALDDRQE